MSGINKVLADIHEITFALACKYPGEISLDTENKVNTFPIEPDDEQRVTPMVDHLNAAISNSGDPVSATTKFNQAVKSAADLIEHLNTEITDGNSWKNKLPDNTFWNQRLTVINAYWTNIAARFTEATRMAHNNNPSDVVVLVESKGEVRPLGVSLKATFGKTDIGMYNGSVGTFLRRTVHGEDVNSHGSIYNNKLSETLKDHSIVYLRNLLIPNSETKLGTLLESVKQKEIDQINSDSYLTQENLVNGHPYTIFFNEEFYKNCGIDMTGDPNFNKILSEVTNLKTKKLVYKYLVPDTKKGFKNDPYKVLMLRV